MYFYTAINAIEKILLNSNMLKSTIINNKNNKNTDVTFGSLLLTLSEF